MYAILSSHEDASIPHRSKPAVLALSALGDAYMVCVNMAFNLGMPRLNKFKKMWSAIEDEDYDHAAVEMLDSRWASQVKGRATKLANAMHNGEF